MTKSTTERTSSTHPTDPKAFRAHMGVEATTMFDRSIDASEASERSIAAGIGYSTENLRHLRDHEEGKHVQLRDVLCLATIAPDAYRHIVEAMAARIGMVVVEKVDGAQQAALIDHAIEVKTQGDEASTALLRAVKSRNIVDLRNAERELTESTQADNAAISLVRALIKDHETTVSKATARGGLS